MNTSDIESLSAKFAKSFLRGKRTRHWVLSYDEVMPVVREAIVEAIPEFDESKANGYSIETFLYAKARQKYYDYVRRIIGRRSPKEPNLARQVVFVDGVGHERLHTTKGGSDSRLSTNDFVVLEADPYNDEGLDYNIRSSAWRVFLSSILTPRQLIVVYAIHYLGLTLDEIGKAVGFSHVQVWYDRNKAYDLIRANIHRLDKEHR